MILRNVRGEKMLRVHPKSARIAWLSHLFQAWKTIPAPSHSTACEMCSYQINTLVLTYRFPGAQVKELQEALSLFGVLDLPDRTFESSYSCFGLQAGWALR